MAILQGVAATSFDIFAHGFLACGLIVILFHGGRIAAAIYRKSEICVMRKKTPSFIAEFTL
jgi:hypothetical protein